MHSAGAGPIRNEQMAKFLPIIAESIKAAPLVVSMPGGRGTADMVRRARKRGIQVIQATQGSDIWSHDLNHWRDG